MSAPENMASFLKPLPFELEFKGKPWVDYTVEHVEIPVFLLSIYLVVVFWLPERLSRPYKSNLLLALWNLGLSVFSMIGLSRVLPTLLNIYTEKGFEYSICYDGVVPAFFDGPSGLWIFLFIYSKLFELQDTVFLVLNKKPVIFLHWFHHVTVLLYCWYSYAHQSTSGIWFAAMNYFVHSIMYFYYCLMVFRPLRKGLRVFAPLITFVQIAQMVGGLVVSVVAAIGSTAGACGVTSANWKLGMAMYVSYFFLFVMLFQSKYCSSKRTKKVPEVCNATDTAGGFRGATSTDNLVGMGKPKNE